MTACGPTKLDGRKGHRNENLHDKPQQSKLDGAAIKHHREGLCSRDQSVHPIQQSDAGSTAFASSPHDQPLALSNNTSLRFGPLEPDLLDPNYEA
jgi:hypothetical protein